MHKLASSIDAADISVLREGERHQHASMAMSCPNRATDRAAASCFDGGPSLARIRWWP